MRAMTASRLSSENQTKTNKVPSQASAAAQSIITLARINRGGCLRRHSCARSHLLQSHSLLYPYPLSERAPTVRGARNTASHILIAVSIRFSNAWLRFRGTADFASPIHSQPMAPQAQPMVPQGNHAGAIGATIRKQNAVTLLQNLVF